MHYLKNIATFKKRTSIFIVLYLELQLGCDWRAGTAVKGVGVGAGVCMVGPETHPQAASPEPASSSSSLRFFSVIVAWAVVSRR